ncbi:unnamed protein product [Gemmataceae bacterium]|nr:unnamed protein product [Gemmataceae bacterium]VTT98932.1 unnamed protein product [Gemmataceae bacterium]
MITPVIGRPGIQSGTSVTYRQVFKQPESVLYLPGGGVIDAAAQDPGNDDPLTLRGGLLMGRKTSGKKWLPSLIGKMITAALTSTGTSITLSAAAAAELVRRVGTSGTFKLTGPPTANGTARTVTVTYSAVNTSTGVVTITAVGVNEVQTLTFGAAATGGTMRLRVPKADGTMVTTDAITWNATDATWLAAINTALDGATGVVGGIVATGAAPDTALTFTFSGTGYAALPQPADLISVHTFPTSATTATVVRTTTGVDGRFVVGSFAQPTDGSEAPVSVVPSGSGIMMAAANARDVDFPQIPYSGLFDSSEIVDWPSDTGLQAWLVAQLNANGGRFEFDHLFANS